MKMKKLIAPAAIGAASAGAGLGTGLGLTRWQNNQSRIAIKKFLQNSPLALGIGAAVGGLSAATANDTEPGKAAVKGMMTGGGIMGLAALAHYLIEQKRR